MAIDYSFQIDGDLLICETRGFDESYDEAAQYGKAVVSACLDNGCKRVLCDERELEYKLGKFDVFKLAESLTAFAPQIIKAALVYSPNNVEDAVFWETVGVNRGATVKVFQSRDEAMQWVLE